MSHVCPHCGDPLIHQSTVNGAGDPIERDVCPRGIDFFSTGWAANGEPSPGAYTDSYRGQDFSLAPSPGASPADGVADALGFTGTAGEDLSGHRVVTTDATSLLVYPDPAEALQGPLWLTTQAAAAGYPVNVVTLGIVEEGSWAWAPGQRVYLTAGGVLTQTPLLFATSVALGSAITATRLFLNPSTPIALVA